MLNILKSFATIIVSLVQLVVNIVTSLFAFIVNIPTYTAFLFSSFNVIPSVVLPFATASVLVYVMLFIVNRKAS